MLSSTPVFLILTCVFFLSSFIVTDLSDPAVKVMDSAFSYPPGACISVSVYFAPDVSPFTTCCVPSEVHSSTVPPDASVMRIFAPLISDVPVMSFFDALTCAVPTNDALSDVAFDL